jgi:hypothetical protein
MAKIVYACSRRASFGPSEERKLEKICKRLEPDNLASPVPHKVLVDRHVAYGIVNGRGAATQGSSVLLGCLYGDDESWYQPGAAFPEGSYAIARNGAHSLEVVSDAAASRTVWYSFDEERFVASTSQRARRSRWLAPRGRASRRWSSWSRASTIRQQAPFTSMVSTRGPTIRAACGR